jgi:hypothetical protein
MLVLRGAVLTEVHLPAILWPFLGGHQVFLHTALPFLVSLKKGQDEMMLINVVCTGT